MQVARLIKSTNPFWVKWVVCVCAGGVWCRVVVLLLRDGSNEEASAGTEGSKQRATSKNKRENNHRASALAFGFV